MHCISIQIQPAFSGSFDKTVFLKRVRTIRSPEVDIFEERGKRHIHFNFFTESPAQLWQELTDCLYGDKEYGNIIAPISIAICEDDTGENFLLLHHFDPDEKPDAFQTS